MTQAYFVINFGKRSLQAATILIAWSWVAFVKSSVTVDDAAEAESSVRAAASTVLTARKLSSCNFIWSAVTSIIEYL